MDGKERLQDFNNEMLADVLFNLLDCLEKATITAEDVQSDYLDHPLKGNDVEDGLTLLYGRRVAMTKQSMALDYMYKARDIIEKLNNTTGNQESTEV